MKTNKFELGQEVWVTFGQEPCKYIVTRLPVSKLDNRYECGSHVMIREHYLFATREECILNEIKISEAKITDEKVNLDYFKGILDKKSLDNFK